MAAMVSIGRTSGALKLRMLSPCAPGTLRCLSLEGVQQMPEREKAQEAVYFNKQEEQLLRGLLKKIKSQADKADKHGAAGHHAAEMSALKDIIGKYNVSHDDVQALLDWKHS